MPVIHKNKNTTEKSKLRKCGVYKKSSQNYEYKSERLFSEVTISQKRRNEAEEIKIYETEVSLDVELFAFIKDCKKSKDGNYLVIEVLIFENSEPIEKTFVYSFKDTAINYLLQMARKFENFRNTENFVDIIGCAAIVIISKNKGFLNMKIEKEITIQQLDCHILKLEKVELEELPEETEEEDELQDE